MPIPTLVDLKAHLNINTGDTSNDAELIDVLDASLDVVAGIVGPLQASAITETHYGVSSPVVVLRQAPVVDLGSVRIAHGHAGLTLTYSTSDVLLDSELGAIRLVSGQYFRGDVTVTYSGGRSVIPPAVALAALIIAKQFWETQRGAQPLPIQGAAENDIESGGYAPGIPERARVLLDPFARGPQVA